MLDVFDICDGNFGYWPKTEHKKFHCHTLDQLDARGLQLFYLVWPATTVPCSAGGGGGGGGLRGTVVAGQTTFYPANERSRSINLAKPLDN